MFIALEGIDGAGKTTQVETVADVLKEHYNGVVKTRCPGGTKLGGVIRQELLNPNPDDPKISDKVKELLYTADRALVVNTIIRPALLSGQAVVSDRYLYSTYAYRGEGVLFIAEIRSLHNTFCNGLIPDLNLFYTANSESGFADIVERNSELTIKEAMTIDRRYRKSFYGGLAGSCVYITADMSLDAVTKATKEAVVTFLSL